VLSLGVLHQHQYLPPAYDIVTEAPDLGQPLLPHLYPLEGLGFVTGSPDLGTPVMTERLTYPHTLLHAGIVARPMLTASLKERVGLSAELKSVPGLTGTPGVDKE